MRKRLLPIALILLIAILFAPLCSNFVREVVVIPFLYIFWILRFLFMAIPQAAFWPCFVVLLFLIMVVSFMQSPTRRKRKTELVAAEPQRVAEWVMLLEKANGNEYFKWRLAQQLQKLMLDSVAHQKGQSFAETRTQLRQNMLEMPPDVNTYFQASQQPLGSLSSGSRFSLKRRSSPLDLDPEIVAAYLEELNHTENDAGRDEAERR